MELAELAALVDEYDAARDTRLAADREAESLKKDETALADRIVAELNSQGVRYAAGTVKRVKLTPQSKPKAEDWPLFYLYMKEEGAFDLLQKRLSEAAIKERTEDGIVIPGIVFNEFFKLSLGKIDNG